MSPVIPDLFLAEDHPVHDKVEGDPSAVADWITDPDPQLDEKPKTAPVLVSQVNPHTSNPQP